MGPFHIPKTAMKSWHLLTEDAFSDGSTDTRSNSDGSTARKEWCCEIDSHNEVRIGHKGKWFENNC